MMFDMLWDISLEFNFEQSIFLDHYLQAFCESHQFQNGSLASENYDYCWQPLIIQ